MPDEKAPPLTVYVPRRRAAARAGFYFHLLRKSARRVRRCAPLTCTHLPTIFSRGLSKEQIKMQKLNFSPLSTYFFSPSSSQKVKSATLRPSTEEERMAGRRSCGRCASVDAQAGSCVPVLSGFVGTQNGSDEHDKEQDS